MKNFLFIMILVLGGFLFGCRASKESKARDERTRTEEIGVDFHRVDSLWKSIAERLTYKIEFYPPTQNASEPGNAPATGSPLPTAPSTTMPAASLAIGDNIPLGGGMGAVKSIEITTEHDAQSGNATQVDSTYNNKTDTTETLQRERASEARQDNGTITIVSVVAAVVVLLALLIIIKKFFHK